VTPEDQAVLADSMGPALLVVLDRLNPAERISFVLHDMFSVSFEEVAWILDKSPEACRQLASRARRRVRIAEDPASDPQRQSEIVNAFLAAAKTGDFQMLLSLLSPDVELVADPAAVAMGAPANLVGPNDVALRFSGGAKAARTVLLDGLAGLVWAQGGAPHVAFDFTVVAGKVTRIEMIADSDVLGEFDIEFPRRPNPR
jgi:RNA polymerase sigma-70 factor (ECF subfamily)